MIVMLGMKKTTVMNDGGIVLTGPFRRNRRAPLVVLSIEVHTLPFTINVKAERKMHNRLFCRETKLAHAAQIYGEMLGQICHVKYYNNPDTQYQEVSHKYPYWS